MTNREYEGLQISEEIGSQLATLTKMIEAIHYDPEGIRKNEISKLKQTQKKLEDIIRKVEEIQEAQEAAREA